MLWSRSAYTTMFTLKDGTVRGGAQHLTTMEACEKGAGHTRGAPTPSPATSRELAVPREHEGLKPLQEEESEEQQHGSHSGDYELHAANEVMVALHVLCIVVLSCYGHHDLHRLSIQCLVPFAIAKRWSTIQSGVL